MSEYKLTEEEKETLKNLREFSKKIDNVPDGEKIPVSNPEKYSFPIGMNDEGNLNVVEDNNDDNFE